MVIEYARDVLGITDANSSEFDPDCANPVIATMEEQKDIVAGKGDMGHTMRLGSYPAELEEGSIVAELYGTTHVTERHRHRYEVNVAYKDRLREGGLVISGQSLTVNSPNSSNCRARCIRSTWPPRPIRNSSPVRPSRIRCSRVWSRPLWTTSRRAETI